MCLPSLLKARREITPQVPKRAAAGKKIAIRLTLIGFATLSGCSQSGEGTVQIPAESRGRILPHTAPNAKDKKGNPIGNKSLSVKDKIRPGTSPKE